LIALAGGVLIAQQKVPGPPSNLLIALAGGVLLRSKNGSRDRKQSFVCASGWGFLLRSKKVTGNPQQYMDALEGGVLIGDRRRAKTRLHGIVIQTNVCISRSKTDFADSPERKMKFWVGPTCQKPGRYCHSQDAENVQE
jgi:hypothetical protein